MKNLKRGLTEPRSLQLSRNPAMAIVLSFMILIAVGTLLLMLPISSRSGQVTPLIEALFTATSASCVTGLIVYDTYTYFSIFGQVVIMMLIQLGGLGLVTLTSFFYMAIGKKMGLRTAHLAQESVNSDERINTNHLIKVLMVTTFSAELLGALMLMPVLVPEHGSYGIFMSFFLAVSAYCNAGFDLLGMYGEYCSLMPFADNFWLVSVLMLLIICGGLGFIVWQDLYNYRKTKKLMLHSKIVLVATGFLILFGTAGYLFFEWGNPNTLGPMNFFEKVFHSMFQSVSTRTAGFNTFDQNAMSGTSKFFSVFLMFIGAAPGSTGGGIKITTAVVLVMTVFSIIRGDSETVIRRRRIDKAVVYRSFSVCLMAGVLVIIATGVLILTGDAGKEINGLFESVSAFATVGLSVGVSGEAGVLSRLMLIFTMFFGRVGPVAFALSLSLRGSSKLKKQVMPEGKIWVG